MKSLFNLRELSNEEIKSILDDAMAFENGLQYDLSHKMIGITRTNSVKHLANLYSIADVFVNPTVEDNYSTTNLFFEPSTRTQYSFQVAQAKLKMQSINFNPVGSSLSKGESFYDTVKTFASFGVDACVIRHQSACLPVAHCYPWLMPMATEQRDALCLRALHLA